MAKYIIIRSYECPFCTGVFEVRHKSDDLTPPTHCYLCAADVSKKPKKKRKLKEVLGRGRAPAVLGNGVASRSVHQVYRQMENATEGRIQDAADILGVDRSSLSSMKLTNMKDNAQIGESSNIPSPATKLQGGVVDVSGVGVGQMTFQQNQQAVEYARSVSVGPEASTGKQFRNQVVSGHQMRAAQIARAGRLNKE